MRIIVSIHNELKHEPLLLLFANFRPNYTSLFLCRFVQVLIFFYVSVMVMDTVQVGEESLQDITELKGAGS